MLKNIALLFFILFSIHTFSQKKDIILNDVNGLWSGVNNENFKNNQLIIAQDRSKIIITHYLEYKGISMIEYGIGTIKGDDVAYDVIVTKAIPGWALKGKHILKLNKTKDSLIGIYDAGKGNTGEIVFKRLK
mgnify:CR=1 FL=1